MAGRSFRKSVGATAAALCGLAALIAFATAFAFPAAAAVACPQCYGFEELSPGVFLERGASAAERTRVEAALAEARRRVRDFYGDFSAPARLLICESPHCYRRLGGGGSRGRTITDLAVFLSPQGANATIAAHELSHVQIHERIGLIRTLKGDVPEWFVEGVAVLVSDDPRYLAPVGAADRCLLKPDGPLPTTLSAWVKSAAREQLYAKAACAVSRWMAAKGGPNAVVALLDQIAKGGSFDAAYQ